MRLLLVLALLSPQLRAQAAPKHTEMPSRQELDSITTRGTTLWRYDRAAWESTDALLKLHPQLKAGAYIVVHTDSTWTVYFGSLTARNDTFLISYTATLTAPDTEFVVTVHRVALADTGLLVRGARALRTAGEAFGIVQPRPYNHALIPLDSGEWFVYYFPAQTLSAYWPLGGDERFRVSADGTRIIERHRMHLTVIDIPLNPTGPPAGYQQMGFTHTAIVDNRPEDTDVFTVLSRDSDLPEYVVVTGYVYGINKHGHITLPSKL